MNGGNISQPILKNNTIIKKRYESSDTIHQLLIHLEKKGLNWLPKSIELTPEEHKLSYIEGEVPHNLPNWIWEDSILTDIARKLRIFHDATQDFSLENEIWELEEKSPREVICHNDFAPYNSIFKKQKFVGLIDFDVCAPGFRLWDISYTAYRFVPIIPESVTEEQKVFSLFSKNNVIRRLEVFLDEYSNNQKSYLYSRKEALEVAIERLNYLAEWSKNYALEHNRKDLLGHSKIYRMHCIFIKKYLL